jgi:hypothetical protein
MKSVLSVCACGLLALGMLIVVAPSYSAPPSAPNEVMHIYSCEMHQGKTEAQAEALIRDWLKELRKLDGGEKLKINVLWPVAVNNMGETDFRIVFISPSFTAWGKMWDAMKDSPAMAKYEQLGSEIADCPDSAMWESVAIEAK